MSTTADPDATHDPVHRARYTFRADGDDLIVETWLAPDGALPPHLHPRQEERWTVLDGEVRFRLGKATRTLGPADGEQVVPAGTVHGLAGSGDREAHLRCVVRPGLGLQAFLEDSAAAAREGLFRKGGIPRGLRGARWAARFLARHGDDVVMIFPPRPVQSAMIAIFGGRSTSD